jgi:hypothetical protein
MEKWSFLLIGMILSFIVSYWEANHNTVDCYITKDQDALFHYDYNYDHTLYDENRVMLQSM